MTFCCFNADSIDQHGLIQPIAVAKDPDNAERFIVVAGERRFRAFQQLDRETIPAIITTGSPDEIALIENIQRENLHPLDEARGLANLMQKHGYSQGDVSKVVGKSRPTVNELLRLTTLPQVIQDECRTSDTPKSTLIEIAKISSEEEQFAAWDNLKHGGMTVREVRATKKGSSTSRTVRKPAEKVLEAGNRFVNQLRKISPKDFETEHGLSVKLNLLRDQISGILRQLDDNQSGNNEDND